MRITPLLVATALLASSAWAQGEDESPYFFQLGLGAVFSETATNVPGGSIGFDPGYATSVAVGRKFPLSDSFVLEGQVEAYYQYFTVKPKDLLAINSAVQDNAKAFALMLNGVLDWRFTQQYSMYGGVGIGWAKEIQYSAWDSGSLNTTNNDGYAYQGLFGFDYNLGGTYDVRLGYRYFRTEPVTVHDAISGDDSDIDIGQSVIEAVFRWSL